MVQRACPMPRVVAFLVGFACAGGAGAAPPAADMCGRTGDLPQLLIQLQKPTTENIWRDKKFFVLRDADDGSVWAFSLKNTTVHPAAYCRKTVVTGGAATVVVNQICDAGEKACASFVAQATDRFQALGLLSPAKAP